MRPSPDPNVLAWLDSQPEMDVWICAVTVAEIRLGIALLPNGKRKDTLLDLTEQMFVNDFSGQCLSFDCDAAREYSLIVAKRQRIGHPISVEDAQIAAIARVGGLTLSTRNIRDFIEIEDLKIFNPWQDA
jgi:hypothetical protein